MELINHKNAHSPLPFVSLRYSSAIFYFSENPFQKLVETAHIEGKDYSYFNVSSLKDPRYRKYFNVSSLKDPRYCNLYR
jgi:hypothetical protein